MWGVIEAVANCSDIGSVLAGGIKHLYGAMSRDHIQSAISLQRLGQKLSVNATTINE
jgi:hypothetical protein